MMNFLQAVRSGRRFRRPDWTPGIYMYTINEDDILLDRKDVAAEDWELEPEPEPQFKEITADDVGRRVRLRNGDITLILKFNPNSDCGYKVQTLNRTYLTNGRMYKNGTMGEDIVELL